MRKFFISYSRSDITVAQSISHVVERHGYKSLANFAGLTVGSDFAKQITSFIRESDFVLFIASKSSLDSQWCRREAEFAIQQGKTLIPILSNVSEDGVTSSWLFNYAQITNWIKWNDNGETDLIKFLAKYPEPPSSVDVKSNISNSASQIYAPKKSRRGCKIGCICSILILLIVGILWNIFFVWSSNSSRWDYDDENDDGVCYAPNPSPDASTPPIGIDDTIIASGGTLSSDTVVMEEFNGPDNTPSPNYKGLGTSISDENNGIELGIIFIVSLLLIIGVVLYRFKYRKITVKLVADEGCEVYADNHKIADLSANNVDYIRLKKGKYYLSFTPFDKSISKKSFSYMVILSNDLINIEFDGTNDNSKHRTIKCFIAGSTKLESERDALRAAIAQTHNQWAGKNVEILSYTYEDFERKVIEGGQQQLYDNFITNDATIAVFIINGEVGKFTVNEFEKALNAYKSGKHPQILVFKNEHAEYHEQAETLKKVVAVENQYWVDYDSLKTLKLQFMSTLDWLLINSMYK